MACSRKAALPDATLPIRATDARAPLRRCHAAGEEGLDQPPPGREVVIIRRQRPDCVHVIGKDDESVDCKRAGAPDTPDSIAQEIDAIGEQRVAAPLQKIDGEEEATARHAQPTEIRHGSGIVPRTTVGAHIRRITPEG